MLRLDFHVISIFCLHRALYKIHTWKVFVYGNIFSFVKATGTGGDPRWRPDFDLRSRHQTRLFLKWCENEVSFSLWKYQPCYKDINNCLESQFWKLYVDSLSCSSVHFAVFPFLPRVFSLPLTILLICLSSSSTLRAPLSDRDKRKRKRVCNGLRFPVNLDHRHWRQGVPLSYWFAVSGGEIVS